MRSSFAHVYLVILLCLNWSSSVLVAQNRGRTDIIVSAGPVLNVGETPSTERAVTIGSRLSVLHAFTSHVSAELGFGMATFSSVNRERPSDFSTSSVPVDLRLRWSFNSAGATVRPFIFVGVGYQSFSYDQQVLQRSAWREILSKNPGAVADGTLADSVGSSAWYNPVGVGLRFALNPRTCLELALTANPTWSDDLHPLRDGKNDGWISGMVSVSYALNEIVSSNEESSSNTSSMRSREDESDSDGDGLPDEFERSKTHTNPLQADTDGDSINDGDEVLRYRTNPLRTDSDGDTITDGDEISVYHTNPNERDTDAGGTPDGVEVFLARTNPLDPADDTPVARRPNPNSSDKSEIPSQQPESLPRTNKNIEKPAKNAEEKNSEKDSVKNLERISESNKDKNSEESPQPTSTIPAIDSSYSPVVDSVDTVSMDQDSLASASKAVSENDNVKDSGSDSIRSQSETAVSAQESSRYVFAGITFANTQADLLPSSKATLDSAYRLLASNPEMNVEIQGYASKSRSTVQREDLAVDLSKRRAKSVMDYLVYRGISRKRLSIAGYGTQRPIDSANPFNEVNRRIEFLVRK